MNAVALLKTAEARHATWFHDGVRVRCALEPPSKADLAWVGGPEFFQKGNPAFIQRRVAEFRKHGASTVLAPNVSGSTTNLINPGHLTTVLPVAEEITLYGNRKTRGDLLIADPFQRHAIYARTRGCGVLILVWQRMALWVHLNRRNAIDHRYINDGKRGLSQRRGAIHAAAQYFDLLGAPRKEIKGCLFGHLDRESLEHSFSDPYKGGFNRKMYRRFRTLGYTDKVMEPDTGYFSLEEYVCESLEMLDMGEVSFLFSISNGEGFGSTRDPDPKYSKVNNTSLTVLELA